MKNNTLVKHFTVVLSLLLLTSCGGYLTALNLKNATTAPVNNYKSNSKKMRFIGISHVAKPELYQSVQEEIIKAKNEGYVLFWEFIDFNEATETELRKVRKMIGFVPSLEGYAKQSKTDLENGYVIQDNTMFLGHVNNKDFNIDITPTELISAYEEKYGEIILNQNDINTPINNSISETLPPFNVLDIIKDHRNSYLANEIENSKFDKIVVLYGALHRNGLFSDLKKLDNTWEKNN